MTGKARLNEISRRRIRIWSAYICIDLKCHEWVLRQQVMVFTPNVQIFKNRTAEVKDRRKRRHYMWMDLHSHECHAMGFVLRNMDQSKSSEHMYTLTNQMPQRCLQTLTVISDQLEVTAHSVLSDIPTNPLANLFQFTWFWFKSYLVGAFSPKKDQMH